YSQVQGLKTRANPGDRTVVVGSLDIDRIMKSALPFGQMIGHIGNEIRIAALRLAHDAIFVVAGIQFSGSQPEGAFAFVCMAVVYQSLYGLFDASAGIKRAFQIEIIEFQAEGL